MTPRLDGREAHAIVRFSQPADGPPVRVAAPELHFVPYYRFTAHDFRWERQEVEEKPAPLRFGMGGIDEIAIEAMRTVERALPERKTQLRDRYVEKNFRALREESSPFPYSLGVRPTVVRLELFRPVELAKTGKIVPPELTPAEAMERGRRPTGTSRLLHRELLGEVLSLVYFPFWIAPVQARGETTFTLVDGVSSKIVAGDVRGLPAASAADPGGRTVGFRSLACPNCGWDLPLRSGDVLFCCTRCRRGWELDGTELERISCAVATVKEKRAARDGRFLPFWEMRQSSSAPFLVPAFHCRRLKLVSDLGMRLSEASPDYEEVDAEWPVLEGGCYDRSDAAALARFVRTGLAFRESGMPGPSVDTAVAERLVWIPFGSGPYAYIDPFLGTAIPKNLLS